MSFFVFSSYVCPPPPMALEIHTAHRTPHTPHQTHSTTAAMATRLACAAASRARSSALRAGIALKAPRCRVDPSRGTAAALISSSSCSRTSTTRRAASGDTNTAPTSTVAAAAAAPVAGTQGVNVGTAGTASSAAVDAKAGSAAEPLNSTDSDPPSTNAGGGADSSSGGNGGGGGGGSRGPLTWGAVGLLGVVATLAVGYYRMKWEEKQNRTASEVGRHLRL